MCEEEGGRGCVEQCARVTVRVRDPEGKPPVTYILRCWERKMTYMTSLTHRDDRQGKTKLVVLHSWLLPTELD